MRRVAVLIFGVGGVGRALLKQIVESREAIHSRAGCRFDVLGVVDSGSWVWANSGLEDGVIDDTLERKIKLGSLGNERPEGPEILSLFAAEGGDLGLMVDATAGEGMEKLVNQALELGIGVVLANKKPLTGPWELSHQFYNNPRLRHEATVAGGQPVIEVLGALLDSGDEVISIKGQLSGTMSRITRHMDDGLLFSVALKMAWDSGVTEPDPREDLNGWDAARKLVIMGRVAGWPLELADIEVESLTPKALANLPLDEFMSSISELDDSIAAWRNTAKDAGMLLRYLAHVERGGGSVGLKAIRASDPAGSNKTIAIRTRRYDAEPLNIGSNTSGPESTAAGVLSDMVRLVRES